MQIKFRLGRVVATPGALEALEASGQEPTFFIDRHVQGDWGEASSEDAASNDAALADGGRLMSVCRTLRGAKLWVVTEAEGDDGVRASTCLTTPSEY